MPGILITGIQAAGKASVAQAVAERLDRSVHLRGDAFRRMIVNGRASMGPADPPDEAVRQLRLRYRLAAQAAAWARTAAAWLTGTRADVWAAVSAEARCDPDMPWAASMASTPAS